ncbi:hypothetical protein E4P41_20835 [Geodermatophilus sp. DF01-2]|uniref:hypothetical protein n=1 Tax=Geodermatophilus sp. DF01-2 TaxID=2559610 RepID=UPI001073996F|nr:hypothetical protein [Geodermatophilus sp. DF01_2]TFV53667.1 hypothetical protein E4P41_20835 [Geodermatophilus sp. DF01_2]
MALVPVLAACGEDEVPVDTGAVEEPAQDELTELALGETVTVNGEVSEVISPNAFTVGGEEIGENPILVVGAEVPALEEGAEVQVAGTVVEFQVIGFEEDLDLDLVDNEFEDFDGDPAIQATSVTPA